MKFTPEELNQLEENLKHPKGEAGVEVARNMNENNISMTRSAISSLPIKDKDLILEIGHGNCAHLTEVLSQADQLKYSGLDISETMFEQAQILNEKFVSSGAASFHLYDGEIIPFEDNMYDQILTVNTLYFWNDPSSFLGEIKRVLKPGGYFSIAFADKKFMDKLPFVRDKFKLYDQQSFEILCEKVEFDLLEIRSYDETVVSKTGEEVERSYLVGVLTK